MFDAAFAAEMSMITNERIGQLQPTHDFEA